MDELTETELIEPLGGKETADRQTVRVTTDPARLWQSPEQPGGDLQGGAGGRVDAAGRSSSALHV
jgi:hypothetical protein